MKFPHYEMCNSCAIKMGGIMPEDTVCTVSEGTCEYCKRPDQILVPWVDFNWPKDKKTDTKAKMNRD